MGIICDKLMYRFISNLSHELRDSLMNCCRGVEDFNIKAVSSYYKKYPEELQKDIESVRKALAKAIREKYKDTGLSGGVSPPE